MGSALLTSKSARTRKNVMDTNSQQCTSHLLRRCSHVDWRLPRILAWKHVPVPCLYEFRYIAPKLSHNTTALLTYITGSFYCSYGTTNIPSFASFAAFSDDPLNDPWAGLKTPAFNASYGELVLLPINDLSTDGNLHRSLLGRFYHPHVLLLRLHVPHKPRLRSALRLHHSGVWLHRWCLPQYCRGKDGSGS